MKRTSLAFPIITLILLLLSFSFTNTSAQVLPEIEDSLLQIYADHNNTDLSVGTTFYPYGVNSDRKFHFTFWGDYYSNSTSLTHSFLNKLLFGGEIDGTVKEGVSNRLEPQSRAGIEGTAGVSLAFESDKVLGGNTTFFINLSYDLNQNVEFTNDFYKLIFEGNAQFENDTAVFSGLSFNSHAYNQYKLGISKRFNADKINAQVGVGGGFIQGLSNTRGLVGEGWLYTAEDGDYVDIGIEALVERSNLKSYDLFSLRGKGYALDFHGALEIKKWRTTVRADVLDVGQVNWNEEAVKYDVDTFFNFEGVDVNDLFDLSENALSGEPDSLISYLGFKEEPHEYSTALPTMLNLTISHFFPRSIISLTLGGSYRLNSHYRPLVYMKAKKHFHKPGIDIGASFSYGGYGKHNFGLEFGKLFNDQIGILIGSRAVLGYLMPNSSLGSSLYVQLSASF